MNEETAENPLVTFQISEEKWRELVNTGAERSRQKALFRSTLDGRKRRKTQSNDNLDTHEIGMIGEAIFARLMGFELNRDLLVEGDGHIDFSEDDGYDVKTSSYFSTPYLRLKAEDLEQPGVTFILVAVDENARRARYCGYATVAMAKEKAQKRTLNADMGDAYVMSESDLCKALPGKTSRAPQQPKGLR